MMKELELEEIKTLSFEVLCGIRDVCEANGLRYSLTGGTLLGALRHKGFIPWDDDIDIMLPRPDYDRLMQIGKEQQLPFNLMCWEIQGDAYPYPFAKACHKDTVLIEDDTEENGVPLGVYVDIFPVDGIGNHPFSSKVRCMLFQILHGLKITANWTCYRKSNLRKSYYEPARYICYLLSKLLGSKRIGRMLFKVISAKKFETCRFAGRLVGDYGSREIMDRSIFETMTQAAFEGEPFMIIEKADIFLRQLYGDYMQLPPVEKRVTHHQFKAYRKQ